jgi:hypothetical protein
MSIPAEIVFRYNGDPNSDEMELHTNPELALPPAESVIGRNGRSWKVSKVEVIPPTSEMTRIPLYRVCVTEIQPDQPVGFISK